ncbi:alanine racemase [Arthrobacter sp. zg-ZUI100]|nr:alanine racemase [Arthrobacter jiangjiafuii]
MQIPRLGDNISQAILSGSEKGLPSRAAGMRIDEFLATRPRLSEFWTPLLVLNRQNTEHNIQVMARWAERAGFELMPHGKTSMSPHLWARQLEAGATGITLATMGQVRTARHLGFDSLLLANEVSDPHAVRYIAGELADPTLSFTCWVDSVAGVAAMEQALAQTQMSRPLDVCVDMGAENGRTGARSVAEGLDIGRALAASGKLRLAGIGGYEGALAHDRSTAGLAAVRSFLRTQLDLHSAFEGLYDDDPVIVTAGGSAYFDVVAEEFAPAMDRFANTRWVLRSGAYVTHDDGFYLGISPLAAPGPGPDASLRPALTGLARVISTPEPGLALLDGGKRDFPYDEGLPHAHSVASEPGAETKALENASVTAMNDQHSFLRFDASTQLAVGDVVTLGLSHPCTAFDKWRLIPVVDDADSDVVTDLIPTFF